MKTIVCGNCLKTHGRETLSRSCCHCFLCTGCEIYRCPNCQEEIVVKPLNIEQYGQPASAPDTSEKTD